MYAAKPLFTLLLLQQKLTFLLLSYYTSNVCEFAAMDCQIIPHTHKKRLEVPMNVLPPIK